jgi:hypothetical protein
MRREILELLGVDLRLPNERAWDDFVLQAAMEAAADMPPSVRQALVPALRRVYPYEHVGKVIETAANDLASTPEERAAVLAVTQERIREAVQRFISNARRVE